MKTLYLYLATARSQRMDYSLFLYAEDDEQAQAKVDKWWNESCEVEPSFKEKLVKSVKC